MSNVRRKTPDHVWPHYRVTLDLYAVNDQTVGQIIEHISEHVGGLPNLLGFEVVGDDSAAAKAALADARRRTTTEEETHG